MEFALRGYDQAGTYANIQQYTQENFLDFKVSRHIRLGFTSTSIQATHTKILEERISNYSEAANRGGERGTVTTEYRKYSCRLQNWTP